MKKKILIIGANSAIAKHCSKIWAERGDDLYLVARNEERLKKLILELNYINSSQIYFYHMDLNDLSGHSKMLDTAEAVLTNIDIILIAHGTLSDQKNCEQNVDNTILEIKTNALSVVSLLTLIANRFEKKKSGTVAVLSSVAGDRGRASNYVYGSAKAMITEFMSGLRQRLHKSNISVITIKPGLVDTPMTAQFEKGFLWTKPATVAKKIVHAIDNKKEELYVPAFWWIVMKIIRTIPNTIFKRLNF